MKNCSRSFSWVGLSAFALITLFVLSGCKSFEIPRTQFDAKGNPVPYKRTAKYNQRDYFHNFRRVIYDRVDLPFQRKFSPDQTGILAKFNEPGYVRQCFISENKEKTQEWIYLDRNLLVQFVEGDLVYSGPIGDVERLLIRKGLPDYIIRKIEETGAETEVYIYKAGLGKQTIYSFAGGTLLTMSQ